VGFCGGKDWGLEDAGGFWVCLGLDTYLGSGLEISLVEDAVEEPSPPRRRAYAAASGVMYSSMLSSSSSVDGVWKWVVLTWTWRKLGLGFCSAMRE